MGMLVAVKDGETVRMVEVDALAREVRAGITALGQTVPTGDDAVLTALGAYDAGAHVTDTMSDEELGQFLEEFEEAWHKAADPGETATEGGEPPSGAGEGG